MIRRQHKRYIATTNAACRKNRFSIPVRRYGAMVQWYCHGGSHLSKSVDGGWSQDSILFYKIETSHNKLNLSDYVTIVGKTFLTSKFGKCYYIYSRKRTTIPPISIHKLWYVVLYYCLWLVTSLGYLLHKYKYSHVAMLLVLYKYCTVCIYIVQTEISSELV